MTRPDEPGRVDNVDGTDEPTPIDGDDGCENIDDLIDLEAEKERDEEQKSKAEEEDKKEEEKKEEEKEKKKEKKEEDGDLIKIFTVSIPAITLGYQLQLRNHCDWTCEVVFLDRWHDLEDFRYWVRYLWDSDSFLFGQTKEVPLFFPWWQESCRVSKDSGQVQEVGRECREH